MSAFRNTGTEAIAFRDDAGKHTVEPGQTFAVVGEQHVAHVGTLTVERVEDPEPQPAEEPEPQPVPARARRTASEADAGSAEGEGVGP